MKIIDSNGVEIATPDLTKGYLKPETQTIHHDAVAGVEEVTTRPKPCRTEPLRSTMTQMVAKKAVMSARWWTCPALTLSPPGMRKCR